MNELMAVEAALFSAGRALDATEVAEATGLSRNKAIGALDSLVELYKNREGALEIVKPVSYTHLTLPTILLV